MAKLLSLNTHSWMESNATEKLDQVVEWIDQHDYDLVCFQEANQLMEADEVVLDSYYIPAPSQPILRRDNYAKCVVERLAKIGKDYYWTWVYNHIGFDVYNEGVAILSKNPIQVDEVTVSQIDDETDYRTRRVALAQTTVDEVSVTVASVHLSWWDKGFQEEWATLETALKNVKRPIILMGDFNNPEYSAGYRQMMYSPLGLQDTFEVADNKNGRETILADIAGWAGNREALRIDYILTSKDLPVNEFNVVFDGKNGPVVSDHFGVSCQMELR